MYQLSIFPDLLTFQLLAPFILRLVVAVFIISLGRSRYHKEYKWLSVLYIATGLLLAVGLYTQVVALVAIAVLKLDFYFDYWKNKAVTPIKTETYFLYWMAMLILLSLMVTGPGFFAFDLPL